MAQCSKIFSDCVDVICFLRFEFVRVPDEAATGTITVIIHVGGEEVSVTSEPDSADKITLSQLREQQKQDVGSSSPHDPTVEASRKLLRDLDSQRNNLFITLCMTAELDEVEC